MIFAKKVSVETVFERLLLRETNLAMEHPHHL